MQFSNLADKIVYLPMPPGTPHQRSVMCSARELAKPKEEAIAQFLTTLLDEGETAVGYEEAESIWLYCEQCEYLGI